MAAAAVAAVAAAAATSQRLNDFWPEQSRARTSTTTSCRGGCDAVRQISAHARDPRPEWRPKTADWRVRGTRAQKTSQTKDPYIMACHGKLIHSQDDGCCAANSPPTPPSFSPSLSLPVCHYLPASALSLFLCVFLPLLFSFSHFWLCFFTVFFSIQWSLNRLRFWTVSRSAPECVFFLPLLLIPPPLLLHLLLLAALGFCFRPYIVFTGRLFFLNVCLWTSLETASGMAVNSLILQQFDALFTG